MPFRPAHKKRPWIKQATYKRNKDIDISFYYTIQWRKIRLIQLNKEPICRECKKAGVTTAATVADHINPVRNGGNKWNMSNLQSLCDVCHNRKSGKESHK